MINYSYIIMLHNTCYACEFQHVFCACSFQTRHSSTYEVLNQKSRHKREQHPQLFDHIKKSYEIQRGKKQRFVIIYHVFIFLTYERHQETHQSHFHFGLASLVCSTHPEKITSGSSQVGENTYA